MLPIVQALKAAGNRVITVLAGRNKDLIILEKEMRKSSDEVIIMTDDGSYGRKGLVTEGVEEVIKREKVDKCFAIGPAIMMKFVCLLTKKYEIPTDVSLNTIMVDGTGMCGACRITVGGKTKFVCVDGPEFDGHQVDFDEMLKRMGAFKNINSPRSMFLIKRGMSIPTGQPSIHPGFAQSRQRLDSVIACSAVNPWFTSSLRLCERYFASSSFISTRGIAVRSLAFIDLRNSCLQATLRLFSSVSFVASHTVLSVIWSVLQLIMNARADKSPYQSLLKRMVSKWLLSVFQVFYTNCFSYNTVFDKVNSHFG